MKEARSCCLLRPDPITLVYVHVPGDLQHELYAHRFLNTYRQFPPGEPHNTVVVCNGAQPRRRTREIFAGLPVRYLVHDDSGWDIGAFQAAARALASESQMLFCCGGPAHFRRTGWLRRIGDVWSQYGPGMYGTCACYEVRPHLNTSGFAVEPWMLADYPAVTGRSSGGDRYEFEHGQGALWLRVALAGYPVLLVTWDGVYEWPRWRKPANGFRRGDQSNCLAYFRNTDEFEYADERLRAQRTQSADRPPPAGFNAPVLKKSAPKSSLVLASP